MKASLARVWRTALFECACAVRARRALVILVLYLLASVGCMYGTVGACAKLEEELTKVLQVPGTGRTGAVSEELWQSGPFRRMVRTLVKDKLVYERIVGIHPVELVYAWFVFLFVPLLAVLTAGNRVAEEIGSGAVRYAIVRETRAEWAAGKYIGQLLLTGGAIAAGALGAWIVALCRLSGGGVTGLLPAMLGWGLRAWIYSVAWIGLALGVSHLTKSGARATAFGVCAITGCGIWPGLLALLQRVYELPELEVLDALVPSGARCYLWRGGVEPLVCAFFHLAVLGAAYLAVGYAVFRRRDA